MQTTIAPPPEPVERRGVRVTTDALYTALDRVLS